MPVITISREFGSEGDSIARQVAQSLGYHFVDKGFVGTVLGQYGVVEFGQEYETLPTFWEKFDAQREERRSVMMSMLHQVVRAVARHGNVVILGRSGFAVLEGLANVLHVRLQAPLPIRVRRVMAQQEIPIDQAEAAVKEHDRVQTAFIAECCSLSWEAIHAFDLVINTGKIPPELAVDWIVRATRGLEEKQVAGERTTDEIQVDPILASAVSDELGCQLAPIPIS
ncbi:MAG: cytidylate kinase-like family protein [Thermoflexales bacterium]|nr:cytidylate kinase-like family protein [Thermoflexales bacterium]